MESQTKVCTCCGIEKPLTEFYRDRRVKKDGLTAQCKNCLDAKKEHIDKVIKSKDLSMNEIED